MSEVNPTPWEPDKYHPAMMIDAKGRTVMVADNREDIILAVNDHARLTADVEQMGVMIGKQRDTIERLTAKVERLTADNLRLARASVQNVLREGDTEGGAAC